MKKWSIRSYLAGIVTSVLILGLCVPAIAATIQKQMTATYKDIKIYVDGQKVTPKDANGNIVEPFVSNGTTYLPVRAVGEAFGKEVTWDGTTNSVYIGERPISTDTSNRTIFTLDHMQYSVDSSWVSQDDTSSRYHYAKSIDDISGGYIYVLSTVFDVDITDKSSANYVLDTLIRGFSEGASVTNMSTGDVETISNHYAKRGTFNYTFDGETFPCKIMYIIGDTEVYTISTMVQKSESDKLDSIFSDVIASIQISDVSEQSYNERLEAVLQRALNGERITYEKFSKIRNGMTYIEVAEIIGDLGTITSQSNGVTIRTWDNGNYGVASIVFSDGKVSAKSQVGL